MESLINAFTDSPEMPGSIAFFDDECLVCNGFVQFLIRHDSGRKSFVFAALQSDYGQAIAHKITSRLGNKETIAFLENGQLYTQSTALLKLLRKLGGRWKILYGLMLIPEGIRDFFYDLFSRNRHLFGTAPQVCFLPDAANRKYFV